jgi:hypothetical protein
MVSVTCSALLSHHESSHSLELSSVGMPTVMPVTAAAAESSIQASGANAPEIDMHPGLDCLAILLVISIATPLLRELLSRRKHSRGLKDSVHEEYRHTSHPPDLKLLSICRT